MARARRSVQPPSDSTSVSSLSSPERAIDDDDIDFFMAQRNDSQSSIGVASFREMTVSPSLEREHLISPISRLPPELLIAVFAKLSSTGDLKNCMLVSKTWARNSVDLLWHRPLCNTWKNLLNVVASVRKTDGFFAYYDLVKRLNLSNLNDQISDGTVQPFVQCKRIERLTLTSCVKLTDHGVIALVSGNRSLLALDITGLDSVTDHTLLTVADNCTRLQGLNITDCVKVTDESLVAVSESCKHLKRLKLNNCELVTDLSILAFADNCPSMLEIDLQNCKLISDPSVTALISQGRHLRELRLAHCHLITDQAFLDLPIHVTYESLRILDLTACHQLHDDAVIKIINAAPRLRNLVLAKCKEITDRAVLAITKLGKNLHYVHLGHCQYITDNAVIQLVKMCNRIRYIDLACCLRLTDASVKQLATLPKLKRIGLVKCQSITDRSILALARRKLNNRAEPIGTSCLERVHLSYCVRLTLQGVHALLKKCPKLTHLSLTGVQAFFLREDLTHFCREAPIEFTDHQRNVFCVYSGDGVHKLRSYLNQEAATYDTEGTMYDAGDEEDGDAQLDQQVAGLMHATGLGGDDEDMDEGDEVGEGSQDGGGSWRDG
ncbi:MAG: SCF E3 ubiquitin ligase complex F-box grrA [Lasallia pustulata]|uniref:SCF E3 ubiquitin ligase complex F-box grrA n=1 Tax=Lasallia pustulata TaxID=136370 RepID=A0A5M8PFE2_9LECA|nr:MAG: SCF E3 ubiquitin ligase complex F-box grrA [Lasallia pustulata]